MICNIAVMFLFIILVSFWGNRAWMQDNSGKHFYIYPESEQPVDLQYSSYRALLKFYLLFNSLVPLDLMVVFILSKMLYTFRLEHDAEMVDEQKSIESGSIRGCSVKNLELLQDFALLTNIFCDKTGTLTKNELVLSKFCVGGKIFGYSLDNLNDLRNELNKFNHGSLINFFRCVCICHDAIQIALNDGSSKSYQGASQDEITFLEACKSIGFAHMICRDTNSISIEVEGKVEKYSILKVIQFTSDRKKMSVVVKCEESNRVINFIKGADISIQPIISPESYDGLTTYTLNVLNQFAS